MPGIEQLPLDSMIGEAIVMDLTFKGTPNARILPEDLDRAERALNDRGITIPPGAILFLRTDWPKVLGYDFAQEEKGADYDPVEGEDRRAAGQVEDRVGSGARARAARRIGPTAVYVFET